MARASDITAQQYAEFTGDEESGFAPITANDYLYLVEGAEVKIPESGRPYVNLKNIVTQDKNGGEFVGRYVFHKLFVAGATPESTKKVMGMTQAAVKAITGEKLVTPGRTTLQDAAGIIAKRVVNRQFVGRTKIEEPDESGKAMGYKAQNRISVLSSAHEWTTAQKSW
jgi:hypothetical protein